MRLQIELSEGKVKDIEELMERGDITTKKELFNYAVSFLDWAVGEAEQGNVIASVDENTKRYSEIQMPVFSAAARRAKKREEKISKEAEYATLMGQSVVSADS